MPEHADADPPIYVEVYLSGSLAAPYILSGLKQHIGLHIRQLYRRLGVPDSSHTRDVWQFYRIEDAPPCKACSWSYDLHMQKPSDKFEGSVDEIFPINGAVPFFSLAEDIADHRAVMKEKFHEVAETFLPETKAPIDIHVLDSSAPAIASA